MCIRHREAGASRTSALPSWSLGAREPGETHISSPERASHASKSLIAGNRLHQALANFIAAAPGLRSPKPVNAVGFRSIKALNEAVSEKRPLLARQSECLLRKLFNCHRHTDTIGTRVARSSPLGSFSALVPYTVAASSVPSASTAASHSRFARSSDAASPASCRLSPGAFPASA
jgi:hypothetical protein